MRHRSTVILSFGLLVVGIAIGATADGWLGSRELRAWDEKPSHNVLWETSRALARVSTAVTPTVVHIQSHRGSRARGQVEETGSGVLLKSSKVKGMFAVTNRHVVQDASMSEISIHLYDGREVHPTRVLTDKATDIALLEVPDVGIAPAQWGDSSELEIGHIVLALGSPFGLSQSVTSGIISAKGRRSLRLGSRAEVLNQDFLQTDAAINPGNSGGPLIDINGRVVGINTAIASNSGGNEGIGFSIPSNLVRRVVDQLLEHGRVQRAYLGVKLDPDFDARAAKRLKLDRPTGARVVAVYDGTPAKRAALRADDVVLSLNGVSVEDENHLINLVSLTPVGTTVRLVILRNGKRMTIRVRLEDRVELNQRSEVPSRPGTGTEIRSMGLTLHTMDPGVATQLGYGRTHRGLLVLKIHGTKNSSGLELYDLIEEVSRQPVGSLSELRDLLNGWDRDEPLLLKVRRATPTGAESHLVLWEPMGG